MPRRGNFEELESRSLLSATIFEHEDIGYFVNASQRRLERYDIAAESWLAPIVLQDAPAQPTAALVDEDGIFVAYGSSLYRYGHDGATPVAVPGTWGKIIALHTDGNLLFVNYSSSSYARFASVDKTTNTTLDTFQNYPLSTTGSSIAPGVNTIFGRTSGVTPADITFVRYSDDGQFTGSDDSPYHSVYPTATRTWVFPDEANVIDSSGTIYSTADLTRTGSFYKQIDELVFAEGELPVALRGNTITTFTHSHVPIDSVTLTGAATTIFVNHENVIAFIADASQPQLYRTQTVPLAELEAAEPVAPVNPVGLAYTPDDVVVTSDGNLLLYSRSHQNLFRWSPITQSYLDSIPLSGSPNHIAYSSVMNTVYLAYETLGIRSLDLNLPVPVEVPFANTALAATDLATAGQYVYAVDRSGSYVTDMHYTFAPDGALISAQKYAANSRALAWSELHQRMFQVRQDSSSTALRWEAVNASGADPSLPPGAIGTGWDSPSYFSAGFDPPLRVAPDGSVVVLGSGFLHSAFTSERLVYALANPIQDAAWISGKLFTIRTVNGGSEIQRWQSSTYELMQSLRLSGSALALVAVPGGRLVAVTSGSGGVPRLTVFNEDLLEVDSGGDFIVRETAGSTIVSESGASDAVSIWLTTPPVADVVIDVVIANPGRVSAGPAVLVFNSTNWNVPQTVTLGGVDDAIVNADRQSLVSFRVNKAASDPGFHATVDQAVSVTTLDDETGLGSLVEFEGIAYFFAANQPHVERFEIASGTWLSPIHLDAPDALLTVAQVDSEGLYVAYGRSVYRYDLDGSHRRHVFNATYDVVSIHTDGNLLFIHSPAEKFSQLRSFNKTTLALISSVGNSINNLTGSKIAPTQNQIFGRTGEVTPARVYKITYTDEGYFTSVDSSIYHQDPYTNATEVWAIPNGFAFIDESGQEINLALMKHVTGTPSGIKDVAFLGKHLPVVLRSGVVTSYNRAWQTQGSIQVSQPAGEITEILINQDTLFGLVPDVTASSGMRIVSYDASALNLPAADAPIDPRGLSFSPDLTAVTEDGIVLLLDKRLTSIFEWNPSTQDFGRTISLSGEAELMTYSAARRTIYLAYAGGIIRQVDLNDPQLVEREFLRLAGRIGALLATDEFVYVKQSSLDQIYDRDGNLRDSRAAGDFDYDPIWVQAHRRIYWRMYDSNYVSIDLDGRFGTKTRAPISVFGDFSPDGSRVATALGHVLDAKTWSLLSGAPDVQPQQVVLNNDNLITRRYEAGFTFLEKWSGTTLIDELKLQAYWDLVSLPQQRLLMIKHDYGSIPVFAVIDQNLDFASHAKITGRRLFYDGSSFDYYPGADGGDEGAIATDKIAYQPQSGVPARSYSHVSSYSRGIVGLMIEMQGPHGEITLDDFEFRVGNSADPSLWTLAPAPTGFDFRSLSDGMETKRAKFTWPAGSIVNTWLQVGVRANANTNLTGDNAIADVFYFGSLVGETGDAAGQNFIVNAGDQLKTRNSIGVHLPVTAIGDHNRDRMINSADLVLSRMPAGFLGLVTVLPVAPQLAGSLAVAVDGRVIPPPTPESSPVNSTNLANLLGFTSYGFGRHAWFDRYLLDANPVPMQTARSATTAINDPIRSFASPPLETPLTDVLVDSLDLGFVEADNLRMTAVSSLLELEDTNLGELLV